jgi:hypothetical protein
MYIHHDERAPLFVLEYLLLRRIGKWWIEVNVELVCPFLEFLLIGQYIGS